MSEMELPLLAGRGERNFSDGESFDRRKPRARTERKSDSRAGDDPPDCTESKGRN